MTPSVGVVARDTASELLAPSDKKRSETFQKMDQEDQKKKQALAPAVKTDNGIISEGPGYSHDALTAKNNLADVEDDARGFTLDGKTFMDRKQALAWVKANEPDVYEKVKKKSEKEGLHSGDYAKAKGIKRKKPGVIEDD
jgi:hypothetical protein